MCYWLRSERSVADTDIIALLRAIAEKLIPGIPEEARISILQQTNDSGDGADAKANRRTVVEEVIERATAKDELEQEIQSMSYTG